MNKFTQAFFVLNLITTCVFSQSGSYVHIRGIIVDNSTNEPLPAVNVFLKNSSIGTFSYDVGELDLAIPDSLTIDTLTLSSIGYHTHSEPIYSLSLALASLHDHHE